MEAKDAEASVADGPFCFIFGGNAADAIDAAPGVRRVAASEFNRMERELRVLNA